MEELKGEEWQKPWFSTTYQGLPKSVTGRSYNGMNQLILDFATIVKGHEMPVFLTFNQAYKDGVHINKGAESIPVLYYEKNYKDESGKRLTEAQARLLPEEDRKKLTSQVILKKFDVFNVADTNFKEVKPELYNQFKHDYAIDTAKLSDTTGMYSNKELDRMISRQEWLCPIETKMSDKAFYSKSNDSITLPLKSQFRKGESLEEVYRSGMEFYSTALHEMTHSTGSSDRLNRLKDGAKFGNSTYAKEELVAELTAASIGHTLGFEKKITDNSAKYLSHWVGQMKEEPKFILNVLSDVSKASLLIMGEVEKQKIALQSEQSLSSQQSQSSNDKSLLPSHREIPVWEAFENERSKTGDFTYHTTAEEYGKTLLRGVEDLLPRVKGTITLNQFGESILSAEIKGYDRSFELRHIPEPLGSWIEAIPRETSHSHMQSELTGRNVDIIAAYIYSEIIPQSENQRIEMEYSTGGRHWGNFNDVKEAKKEGKLSDEEFAAFWALESSMGATKQKFSQTAIDFLNNHIKNSEYYGTDCLDGSKEAITLLESGKVSAEYVAKFEQRTITNPTFLKHLNGEYAVRAKIDDKDTGILPISFKEAANYLVLENPILKEQFLQNLVLNHAPNEISEKSPRSISPKLS